jgi:hypothetical protein
MTTRLAPLAAPEGLRPACFGAAGRAPAGLQHGWRMVQCTVEN